MPLPEIPYYFREDREVKTFGFLLFIFFRSIAPYSLIVCVYDSRSSADVYFPTVKPSEKASPTLSPRTI